MWIFFVLRPGRLILGQAVLMIESFRGIPQSAAGDKFYITARANSVSERAYLKLEFPVSKVCGFHTLGGKKTFWHVRTGHEIAGRDLGMLAGRVK
jgi:hypothetical protein